MPRIANDGDGEVRPGAWLAEITGMLDLSAWPEGMRVIAGHRSHRLRLRLAARWPWTAQIITASIRLNALAPS